jgi:hypothetical protein
MKICPHTPLHKFKKNTYIYIFGICCIPFPRDPPTPPTNAQGGVGEGAQECHGWGSAGKKQTRKSEGEGSQAVKTPEPTKAYKAYRPGYFHSNYAFLITLYLHLKQNAAATVSYSLEMT